MTTGYQIRINDGISTIARISHKTGVIEVRPNFYELDKKVQEFVIEHLTQRPSCKLKNNAFSPDDIRNKLCADKYALAIMQQRYPNVPLKFWHDELEKLFMMDNTSTPDDFKRLSNL